jgi:hypothetical protein
MAAVRVIDAGAPTRRGRISADFPPVRSTLAAGRYLIVGRSGLETS